MRESYWFRFEAPPVPVTADEIRKTNIVKGVSLITVGWARGHIAWDAKGDMYPVAIDAETLKTVMECAKTYRTGLKVKVRHGSGPEDTCGHLSNFSVDGDKLRGDWTLYPTYDRYDHLVTLITTIPDTFGMSIDFSGPREFRAGYAYARCTEIYNCAVVDEPAANPDGLFDRSAGIMNPLIALARFAGIAPAQTEAPAAPAAAPAQPTQLAAAPPTSAPSPSPAAPETPAVAPDPVLVEIRDGLRAISGGLHMVLSRDAAPPPAPQPAAAPAQPTQLAAAPAAPAGASPDVPRLTFEQLQAQAKVMGIQLAARAGVPPVEGAAAPAAEPAQQESSRAKWARALSAAPAV